MDQGSYESQHPCVEAEQPAGDRHRLQIDGIDGFGILEYGQLPPGIFESRCRRDLERHHVKSVGMSEVAGAQRARSAVLERRFKLEIVFTFLEKVLFQTTAANGVEEYLP